MTNGQREEFCQKKSDLLLHPDIKLLQTRAVVYKVLARREKCDQLPVSMKGDGITQALAHISVGTQAHFTVGKHKAPQDKEASAGSIKKLCTMQVHAEDKASVSNVCLQVRAMEPGVPEASKAFSQVATRLAIVVNTPKAKIVAELYGPP
eukprot:Em0010g317a